MNSISATMIRNPFHRRHPEVAHGIDLKMLLKPIDVLRSLAMIPMIEENSPMMSTSTATQMGRTWRVAVRRGRENSLMPIVVLAVVAVVVAVARMVP